MVSIAALVAAFNAIVENTELEGKKMDMPNKQTWTAAKETFEAASEFAVNATTSQIQNVFNSMSDAAKQPYDDIMSYLGTLFGAQVREKTADELERIFAILASEGTQKMLSKLAEALEVFYKALEMIFASGVLTQWTAIEDLVEEAAKEKGLSQEEIENALTAANIQAIIGSGSGFLGVWWVFDYL